MLMFVSPGDGNQPGDAADLLSSVLAGRAADQVLLLDAATVAHGEAAELAHACDGAYLVVTLGQTTRRAAHRRSTSSRSLAGGC